MARGLHGIPYPFGKFDFVLIPSFQFGGMEHAGAIYYNASGLLLDESATQNQLLGRANMISHETSHMWFGDLVTMRWFNDVWMKEVFANFMAAKIVNPSFPNVNHDLRFLFQNYPAAYDVDRTDGANPIRQELANLNEAGSLYGAIIYQKAPIVMRQHDAKQLFGGYIQANRGDQRHERRLLQDRLITQPEHQDAADAGDNHGRNQRRRQAAGLIGDHHPDITAQGEKGGMRDVQDAQQTVDQRQPQRDQGIDAALNQALGDQFDEQHEKVPLRLRCGHSESRGDEHDRRDHPETLKQLQAPDPCWEASSAALPPARPAAPTRAADARG